MVSFCTLCPLNGLLVLRIFGSVREWTPTNVPFAMVESTDRMLLLLMVYISLLCWFRLILLRISCQTFTISEEILKNVHLPLIGVFKPIDEGKVGLDMVYLWCVWRVCGGLVGGIWGDGGGVIPTVGG